MASQPLPLKPSPRTKVFRAVDGLLRGNAALRSIGASFKSWQGEPADKSPFGKSQRVAIRLGVLPSEVGWYSPDSTKVQFAISVDVEIETYLLDDFLNLWYAIEQTFYPAAIPTASPPNAARLAIELQLQAAGVRSGMLEFTAPAPEGPDDSGRMRGTGLIRCMVYETIDA